MKLKYKRIVLIITTFTMLIGMMIFSTIRPVGQSGEDNQSKTANTDTVTQNEGDGAVSEGEEQVVLDGQTITLEKSADEELNQLIANYFNASVACDMDTLKTLVSDVSVLDKDELKIKYELIEAVKNVECYIMNGPSEGKYLVYVYSEIKFKDIETMAPGLSRLTVVKGADGGYVIFFGADSEVEQFVEQADVSAPVQELVQKVNTKMEEALSSDADLKELNEKMTGEAKSEAAE